MADLGLLDYDWDDEAPQPIRLVQSECDVEAKALSARVEIKPEHCINENLAPLQLLLTYALSPHTLQRYYIALNLHTILLRLMKEQENWLELVSPFCRHMALDQVNVIRSALLIQMPSIVHFAQEQGLRDELWTLHLLPVFADLLHDYEGSTIEAYVRTQVKEVYAGDETLSLINPLCRDQSEDASEVLSLLDDCFFSLAKQCPEGLMRLVRLCMSYQSTEAEIEEGSYFKRSSRILLLALMVKHLTPLQVEHLQIAQSITQLRADSELFMDNLALLVLAFHLALILPAPQVLNEILPLLLHFVQASQSRYQTCAIILLPRACACLSEGDIEEHVLPALSTLLNSPLSHWLKSDVFIMVCQWSRRLPSNQMLRQAVKEGIRCLHTITGDAKSNALLALKHVLRPEQLEWHDYETYILSLFSTKDETMKVALSAEWSDHFCYVQQMNQLAALKLLQIYFVQYLQDVSLRVAIETISAVPSTWHYFKERSTLCDTLLQMCNQPKRWRLRERIGLQCRELAVHESFRGCIADIVRILCVDEVSAVRKSVVHAFSNLVSNPDMMTFLQHLASHRHYTLRLQFCCIARNLLALDGLDENVRSTLLLWVQERKAVEKVVDVQFVLKAM